MGNHLPFHTFKLRYYAYGDVMCIENLPGDHTEKPCPLDWLNIYIWDIPVGGKDVVLHFNVPSLLRNITKNYWPKVPARRQCFCQYQLTSSLQFEEDVKLQHYHFQELYLEEEES